MNGWQIDLLKITERSANEHEIFARITAASAALGFEHCAYGFRSPLPLSNPKVVMLNNYPQEWCDRYACAKYLQIDPTVLHGRKSQTPIIWGDDVFADAKELWEEARSFGLRVGWAQSSLDCMGIGGMLTLSRSREVLTLDELREKEEKLQWLVHIAHMLLARVFRAKDSEKPSYLTSRELEVLKWTADGKSAQDIADILVVSMNTVNFHLKNAIAKLQAANKTGAVVRAAMLGHLN